MSALDSINSLFHKTSLQSHANPSKALSRRIQSATKTAADSATEFATSAASSLKSNLLTPAPMESTLSAVLRGVWSGLIATSTMTTTLFKYHQELNPSEKSPLPPAMLTESILKHVPGTQKLSREARVQAAMTSHFAFGATTGVLYSLLAPRMKGAPVIKGALFGLGVWGTSYLGWIPAFGLKPQAPKMTAQRNAMMILAHVVWGATLGYNEGQMRHRGSTLLDGKKNRFLAQ